jgi:hypothetical protein
MRTLSLAGLLAGVALAAVTTGASRAFVATPAIVVVAFGATTLVIVLAPTRTRGQALAAVCTGFALGLALPRSLPVERIVTRGLGDRSTGDLFALLDRLDAQPQAMIGRPAVVSGVWTPPRTGQGASVSRRVMSCCAADALDVGFDVAPARPVGFDQGVEVCVRGFIAARVQSGELRYRIERATVERATMASRCTSR